VQQIKIPLVDDEHFKEFDALLQKRPDSVAKATMIGRFFAAEKTTFQNGNERWMGFGHRGMFSLFVIQQVLSVEPHYQSGLDYGHYVDQPNLENEGCGNYRIMFHNSPQVIRDAQQKAESGERLWSFDDPERVAREGLAQAIGGGTTKPITLSETRRQDGRIVYHWRPNGKKGTRYMVIVNRSYWLSFYSKNPVKVAWVMAAAYSICE
jgi:hypothetical protein